MGHTVDSGPDDEGHRRSAVAVGGGRKRTDRRASHWPCDEVQDQRRKRQRKQPEMWKSHSEPLVGDYYLQMPNNQRCSRQKAVAED